MVQVGRAGWRGVREEPASYVPQPYAGSNLADLGRKRCAPAVTLASVTPPTNASDHAALPDERPGDRPSPVNFQDPVNGCHDLARVLAGPPPFSSSWPPHGPGQTGQPVTSSASVPTSRARRAVRLDGLAAAVDEVRDAGLTRLARSMTLGVDEDTLGRRQQFFAELLRVRWHRIWRISSSSAPGPLRSAKARALRTTSRGKGRHHGYVRRFPRS
jgi:hypothetical protein